MVALRPAGLFTCMLVQHLLLLVHLSVDDAEGCFEAFFEGPKGFQRRPLKQPSATSPANHNARNAAVASISQGQGPKEPMQLAVRAVGTLGPCGPCLEAC